MGAAIIWIFTQWQHLSQEIPGNGCLSNAPTPATHQHQHQQILNPLSPPTNTQSTTTTTTTTHTTTTQQKNKIKHLFETTNLGFLNFKHLLDLISVGLMLLDVISMRLTVNDGLRYYSTLSVIGERFQWVWVRMSGVVWSKFLVFG